MAKRKGRKFRAYIRGIVDESLLLTTLAPVSLVATVFDNTVGESSFLSSIVARWAMSNLTVATNVGPIMVGLAHSDYSAAEIEEFIENTGAWSRGDQISQEVAKRKIRIVGIFPAAAQSLGSAVLNDGKPMKTKCNWRLIAGQSVDLWAYNTGSAAVATTVPVVKLQGHANIWPL